jgi:hypothetical protein
VADSDRVAFHQFDGGTYATVLSGDGADLMVFEWVDDRWVEVPVTPPAAPEGVRLIPDTDSVRMPPDGVLRQTFVGRPTAVDGG